MYSFYAHPHPSPYKICTGVFLLQHFLIENRNFQSVRRRHFAEKSVVFPLIERACPLARPAGHLPDFHQANALARDSDRDFPRRRAACVLTEERACA
ncbi:hypothetical protein [uncultured Desulfovibrio sp.]|uniref:hypothetical protein n=1 Tax=uncultured Desulfovibrio sp. TaxID=167968 RepID=UPI0027120FE1|nr:hypothetical protein [uncultured Desulfovibrio sp.]